MLIKEGYWNYYLAFRIEKYQKHLMEINQEKINIGVVAYISDEKDLVSNMIEPLLKERKEGMSKYGRKGQKLTNDKAREMYMENQLPEYYFDFDNNMNDLLDVAINDGIKHVQFVNYGYLETMNQLGEGKCGYYLLMPLKVYFSEWEFVYCPVYVQLLTNGNGMIKVEIPIRNVLSEYVSGYPLKKWFTQIKVWHELFAEGEGYIIVEDGTENITVITDILQKYIQKIFTESLVDEERFLGFETFSISESEKHSIDQIKDNDIEGIEQVYRLAYPENFAIEPSQNELEEFWQNSRFNVSGIWGICGDRGRMILYTNIQKLLQLHERNDVEEKNEYFNSSISASFDPYILIALAQKDNEMTVYRLVEKDRHTINAKMIQYYSNVNYLDEILINIPKYGSVFYKKVKEMLDKSMIDFTEILHRMENVELYKKTRLIEKQEDSLNKFTLIFTVLFGLPLIQDMLMVIKEVLGIKKDLVPMLNIAQISFVIWVVLVMMLFMDIVERNLEYEGISINEKSFILSKIKKILLFYLYKNRNK